MFYSSLFHKIYISQQREQLNHFGVLKPLIKGGIIKNNSLSERKMQMEAKPM